MKKSLLLFCFFNFGVAIAQEKIELSPNGFPTIEVPLPNIPLENLIEGSKSWAYFYNKRGADVYEVMTNSLKIDALKENAFYYYNIGERFYFTIKYTLAVEFGETTYTLKLIVREIYLKDKIIQSTIPDYFTPDGKIKEGFEDVKPSLENTMNKIINSFTTYIQR